MNIKRTMRLCLGFVLLPVAGWAQGGDAAKAAELKNLSDKELQQRYDADDESIQGIRAHAADLKARYERDYVDLRRDVTADKKPSAKKNLGRKVLGNIGVGILRFALRMYFVDNGINDFPANLKELVPAYIKEIPELDLPGYKPTRKVTVVNKMKGDDIAVLVKDTGGWIYVADKTSKHYGEVFIDAKIDYKGEPFFRF